MPSPRSLFLVLFVAVLAASLPLAARAQSPSEPVVVELFTSQGCSSCPPADELLAELAAREDVVALSLHVDYWDYIGWQDPFADPLHTERQRSYLGKLSNRFIYTPQMVVDGRFDVIGSRRGQALRAIEQARSFPKLPMVLERDRLLIPAGHAPDGGAAIWLALFDERHETQVGAGENAGRKLVNANVVRRLVRLGRWTGEALTLPLDMDAAIAAGRDGCAVLLQAEGFGPILGAALLRLPGEG